MTRQSLRLTGLLIAAAVAAAVAGLAASRLIDDLLLRYRQPANEVSSRPPGLDFVFYAQPRPLPHFKFESGDGKPVTIGDFRGRPVLMNLWATWCVPCRKEMPALDRLQVAVGASELVVLPLSIDREGAPAVETFYRRLDLKGIGIYLDSSATAASMLDVPALPVTLLIDREGREVGRKLGPAEWDSPHITALLREHLRLPAKAAHAGS